MAASKPSRRVFRAWQSIRWDGPDRGKPFVPANETEFEPVLMVSPTWGKSPLSGEPAAAFVAYVMGQLHWYFPDRQSRAAVQIDGGPGEEWIVSPYAGAPDQGAIAQLWYARNAGIMQAVIRAVRADYPNLDLHWFWAVPADLAGFYDGLHQLAELGAFHGLSAVALELYHNRVETDWPEAVAARPDWYATRGTFTLWAKCVIAEARSALPAGTRVIGEVHHKGPILNGPADEGPPVPYEQFLAGCRAIGETGVDLCTWGSNKLVPVPGAAPIADAADVAAESGYHEALVRPGRIAYWQAATPEASA